MSSSLPSTILALRSALERGDIGWEESIAHQFKQFNELGQRLKTVTTYFAQEPASEEPRSQTVGWRGNGAQRYF